MAERGERDARFGNPADAAEKRLELRPGCVRRIPVGGDEEEPGAVQSVSREKFEEQQRRVVGAVKVIDGDDNGVGFAHDGEQPRRLFKEAKAGSIRFGREALRRGLGEFRDEAREFAAVGGRERG